MATTAGNIKMNLKRYRGGDRTLTRISADVTRKENALMKESEAEERLAAETSIGNLTLWIARKLKQLRLTTLHDTLQEAPALTDDETITEEDTGTLQMSGTSSEEEESDSAMEEVREAPAKMGHEGTVP